METKKVGSIMWKENASEFENIYIPPLRTQPDGNYELHDYDCNGNQSGTCSHDQFGNLMCPDCMFGDDVSKDVFDRWNKQYTIEAKLKALDL